MDVEDREEQILKSLGLKKNQLAEESPIKLINTGNSFIIVPVKSSKELKNLKPDYAIINAISEELNLIGYYVFTNDTENKNLDATTRMFGPRYGILEESGTGMAAGPLSCYLYDILKIKKNIFKIQQGKFMEEPSKSLIIVDLTIEHDKIKSLMAGGKGILNDKMAFEIKS